jgi:hypothetical protein
MRAAALLGLMCWLGFGVEGCGRSVQPTLMSGQSISTRTTGPTTDLKVVRGGQHLARLHPVVRAKALHIYNEAERQGVRLRFISGYRKMRRRKSRASWHNFGMAFDLNLVDRRDMKTAVAHYAQDKARWAIVGRIGRDLGMIWGEAWKVEEIFHFEWHPGMPEGLRGANLQTLLDDAGPLAENPEKAWHHFSE